MNVAFDVTGTIDAYPYQCGELMTALKAAGNGVYVLHGVKKDAVEPGDEAAVRQDLAKSGITDAMYDKVIVVPQPHPKHKTEAMRDHDIAVLVDNKKATARKASKAGFMAVVPWATREK